MSPFNLILFEATPQILTIAPFKAASFVFLSKFSSITEKNFIPYIINISSTN